MLSESQELASTTTFNFSDCVPYLEVGLLEDSGEFRCSVVADAEGGDVAQDVCDQLHVVVLHRLQPHVLQSLVGLRGSEAKGYRGHMDMRGSGSLVDR